MVRRHCEVRDAKAVHPAGQRWLSVSISIHRCRPRNTFCPAQHTAHGAWQRRNRGAHRTRHRDRVVARAIIPLFMSSDCTSILAILAGFAGRQPRPPLRSSQRAAGLRVLSPAATRRAPDLLRGIESPRRRDIRCRTDATGRQPRGAYGCEQQGASEGLPERILIELSALGISPCTLIGARGAPFGQRP